MNPSEIISLEEEYVLQTYRRPDFVLVRGEGARVFDSDGRAYLDGVSGIAVNALGHRDPQVVATIQAAAEGPPRARPVLIEGSTHPRDAVHEHHAWQITRPLFHALTE